MDGQESISPVFNLGQYATDIGNSPRVSAGLPTRVGCHGSSSSMKNIAKVCDPALTVNRYCVININSQSELKSVNAEEELDQSDQLDRTRVVGKWSKGSHILPHHNRALREKRVGTSIAAGVDSIQPNSSSRNTVRRGQVTIFGYLEGDY